MSLTKSLSGSDSVMVEGVSGLIKGFCNFPASQRSWLFLNARRHCFPLEQPWIPTPWAGTRKKLMSASLEPESSKKMERNLAHGRHQQLFSSWAPQSTQGPGFGALGL